MLVECGLVRAVAEDGAEFTFRPSFGRIAALGSPQEIVELFAELHGEKAERAAVHVLVGLADEDDLSALLGEPEPTDQGVTYCGGAMPSAERVIIARHLMRHGIVGTAAPAREGSGKFSDRFEAADYIAAARVHLGLSGADAEALSMTEFQRLLAMKFPQATGPRVPPQEEYDSAMAAADEFVAKLKERQRG